MDRQNLHKRLAQAERHVLAGEAHLAKQREIVARLVLGRHFQPAGTARKLLAVLEESQLLHVTHLVKLQLQLEHIERQDGTESPVDQPA